MLHFDLTKIVQRWPPSSILLKVFGDSLRKQDMTGVATIHHALGEINPNPGRVDPIIYVGHRAHGPAVHAHSHPQTRMASQIAADFHGALDRLLGTVIKNERHSVAGRNLHQSARGRCLLEFVRTANNLVELVHQGLLFIRQARGITNDVNKENVRDLQAQLRFRLLRHKIQTLGCDYERLKRFCIALKRSCFSLSEKTPAVFDTYLWSFAGCKPKQNRWRKMSQVPARTTESDAMSRNLVRRGFKFVGSTICYASMQATGMVTDHLVSCPRHSGLTAAQRL